MRRFNEDDCKTANLNADGMASRRATGRDIAAVNTVPSPLC